ncbi:copper chaperone PCu(A)C [Guyparkeria sp.]|uniref:copper chaperone PCu(A)C n=1 Tax=Guyparkeria sp. TaxID=2035736 RepID=UPI003970FF10
MISLRRSTTRITALVALALAMLAPAAHAEISVEDPWVAEAPPTAMALAGFMTIENSDDVDRKLVGAEAPGFDRIELHRSVEVDGVHQMKREDAILVPANGSATLAPGGYHVMLIGLQEPKRAGDRIPLTLIFDDGEEMTVTVPVRKREFMQ